LQAVGIVVILPIVLPLALIALTLALRIEALYMRSCGRYGCPEL
jgi:hypothetical protein